MTSLSQSQDWHPAWQRWRRPLGMTAMILGGLGLLTCLIAMIALWSLYGGITGWVDNNLARIDQLLVTVDGGITTLGATVDSTRQRAQDLVQQVSAIRQNVAPDEATRARIVASVAAIDTQHARLREGYIVARERAKGLLDLADQLRRVPFVSVPELPIAQLEALDARLVQVDQSATALRGSVSLDPAAFGAFARQAAEQARQLDSRLVALSEGSVALQQGLGVVQGRLATTRADFPGWVRLLFSLLTLLLLWVSFLHVSLFYHGWNFWHQP